MLLSRIGFHSHRSLHEWLYVALVLFVFGGYIAYSLYQEHLRIDVQESERLAHQANVVAENLTRQLHSTNLALASLLREIPEWRKQKNGVQQANQHMKALTDAMPGVLTMLLMDVEGNIIAADKPELVGQNRAHREYFKTVQTYPNPATLYVSVPFLTARGTFTMNLARMVPGPGGSFAGIVIAALDPEEFKILLNSVIYTSDMSASLIHGDGMLFLTEPAGKGVVGVDQEKPSSFFTQQLKSGQKANVFTGTSYPVEDESMIAMVTIQPQSLAMDKPLVVAVRRELHAISASWMRDVLWNLQLFGIVTLFAVLGLIYYQKQWRLFGAAAAHHKA